MITYKIDWLAFTLNKRMKTEMSLTEYVDKSLHGLQGHWHGDNPRHGYKIAITHESGLQAQSNGQANMGSHVIIPGSALNTIVEQHSIEDLLAGLLAAQAKFSRIDLALDVINDPSFVVSDLHKQAIMGNIVTQSRAITYMQSGTEGQTLYIGSRTSDRFVRIYNKAAEQKAIGKDAPDAWVRIEIELKADRANNCAHMIGLGGNVADTIRGQIESFLASRIVWDGSVL